VSRQGALIIQPIGLPSRDERSLEATPSALGRARRGFVTGIPDCVEASARPVLPRPRKLRGDVLASNSINPFGFTAEHLSAISIWPKTGNSDVSGCVHRLGQYQRGVVRCNIKISEGLDRHFRFQLITLTPLRLANVGVLTYTVGDSSGTLIMWCVCDYGCLELGLHRDAMSDSNR
jgi:hypothetical protein